MSERKLSTTVIMALAIQVVGVTLGYLLQLLLARWMGSREYGAYATTIAWAASLATLAAIGLPNSVLRFIPEYGALGDWGLMKGFIRSSYALSIGVGGVVGLTSGLLFFTLRHRVPPSTLAILLACSWLVPLLTVSGVQSQLCRAFKWIATALALPMIVQPLVIVGTASLIMHTHGVLTCGGAIDAVAMATLLVLICQWGIFRRRLPASLTGIPPLFEREKWLRVSLPLWLIGGFGVILGQLDLLMVSVRLGPKAAGMYNVATCSSDLVVLGLVAVNAIAAPTYASMFAEGKREEMQALASQVAAWIFWPAVLVSTALALFARPILASFGPEFPTAATAMIILSLGQLVNAGAGSVGYLLGMTGHQAESARVFGWSAVVNIGLNYVGITFFGLNGAAIATAFSMALWNIWLYVLVVRHLSVRPSILFAVFSRLRA